MTREQIRLEDAMKEFGKGSGFWIPVNALAVIVYAVPQSQVAGWVGQNQIAECSKPDEETAGCGLVMRQVS
jgi:hypothetical protein